MIVIMIVSVGTAIVGFACWRIRGIFQLLHIFLSL